MAPVQSRGLWGQRLRRVFFALVLALFWSVSVHDGVHALLSDSAILSTNSITTGSADLLVSNSQAGTSTTWAEVRPGFTYQMYPGKVEDRYFHLKNIGTADVPLGIDMRVSAQELPNGFANLVSFEVTPVDSSGTPVGSPVVSTMEQALRAPVMLQSIVQHSDSQRYLLRTILDSKLPTSVGTATYDLMFTGTQVLGL